MKKFLLMLVICVSSFMIYTNNVKAFVFTTTKHFTDNYIICTSGYGYCEENLNIFPSSVTRTGSLMFTFVSDPKLLLNGVSVNNGSAYFPCDIGTQLIYSDSSTQYNFITAVCPINIGGSGITKLKFTYDDSYINQNTFKFFMSDYYSFYEDLSSVDYTTLLNQINSNISNLNTALGGKIDNISNLATLISGHLVLIRGQIDDIKNKLDSLNTASSNISNNTEQIKNDIKSENVSGAESSADDLKNNSAFQDNTGLSGVISMPLTFVNSLTNTCQPINLTIPYMDVDLSIPCIQPIITNKMPLLANLIKIVVNGFIVYRILLDIFQIVRNAKNPEDDRIEVLDL